MNGQALARWSGEEQLPALLSLLAAESNSVGWAASDALGRPRFNASRLERLRACAE